MKQVNQNQLKLVVLTTTLWYPIKAHSAPLALIIFVPLVYLYVNYLGMGPEGIVFSIITCQLINSFVTPYQYYLVINKKDTGIWSR